MVAFGLFVAALAASSPPPVRVSNKVERKFDDMIDALNLSPAAIACIGNPRSRVLFRGVAAACDEPQVRTAFRIVYRDLVPVRVAGDLIFAKLTAAAVEAEAATDGMTAAAEVHDLAASRRLFDLMDGDGSGGLDREELLASPKLLDLLLQLDEAEAGDKAAPEDVVDRFMSLADENGDGEISFVEFANAAASRPRLRLADEALAAAAFSFGGEASAPEKNQREKRKRFFGRKSPEERFDAMLAQCLEWEAQLDCGPAEEEETDDDAACLVDVALDAVPVDGGDVDDDDDEGRLLQVLKGSLVGARCDPVVEALRMVYLDYSPLRLGGDVIFKLLGRVVASQLE